MLEMVISQGLPTPEFETKAYYYRLKRKVMFSEVFVCPQWGGGVGRPHTRQRSPSGQRLPSWTETLSSLKGDPPLDRDPLLSGGRPPLDRDPPMDKDPPPQVLTSSGSLCSGWSVSYWNAFLFDKIFAKNCIKMKEIGPREGWHAFVAPLPPIGSTNGCGGEILGCSSALATYGDIRVILNTILACNLRNSRHCLTSVGVYSDLRFIRHELSAK